MDMNPTAASCSPTKIKTTIWKKHVRTKMGGDDNNNKKKNLGSCKEHGQERREKGATEHPRGSGTEGPNDVFR